MYHKIAQARKKSGLTQEQLAELTHVTVRTIQRIENGQSVPRAFTLKALATALGTTVQELAGPVNDGSFDPEKDRHFLQVLCLSCFGYLVIPFVHFLVPAYLLKKSTSKNPKAIVFGRRLVRQQLYWAAGLSILMMLVLVYNILATNFFNKPFLLSYLWIFFGMYFAKVFLIAANLRQVKNMDLNPQSPQKA
ncbi:helix-turn-helix transcriptional regulator [Pedobacter sp. KR3-3]|uniref:Helix-turn-helix transcriptional regulator n=1 Tax=Pedobacter albus TaxID=3113905 RepID=A0ABU7I919_9SPHI|nr:helix-turn-helix transcriptional regulator [Pedobacter sp. KR3-3]MEE1945938.1 helix-turn-helix transcriptional regulator [Pedobacter sp. KR3-3]